MKSARIIATSYSKPATKSSRSVYELISSTLQRVLNDNQLDIKMLDGLITVQSLAEPKFMVCFVSLNR